MDKDSENIELDLTKSGDSDNDLFDKIKAELIKELESENNSGTENVAANAEKPQPKKVEKPKQKAEKKTQSKAETKPQSMPKTEQKAEETESKVELQSQAEQKTKELEPKAEPAEPAKVSKISLEELQKVKSQMEAKPKPQETTQKQGEGGGSVSKIDLSELRAAQQQLSSSSEPEPKPAEKEEQKQKEPEEQYPDKRTNNYDSFYRSYGHRAENFEANYGKYDSDLDFKLNTNVKRVHLPVPKNVKIILFSSILVVVLLISTILGVTLYKKPEQVVLSSVELSQPKINGNYTVLGKHIGDKFSYDNIYVVSTYSNGTIKKQKVDQSMIKNIPEQIIDGKFAQVGDVVIEINYQGHKMQVTYVVTELAITGLSCRCLITSNISDTKVDLTDKLIIIASFRDENGTVINKLVDISDCTYRVAGTNVTISGGEIDLSKIESLQTSNYQVEVSYKGYSATFNLNYVSATE